MNIKYKNFAKNIIWNFFNWHKPGDNKDIVIFTSRRSGGTWLTEMIANNKKVKYVNQPLDLKMADYKQKKLLPNSKHSKFVCLNDKEETQVFDYFEKIFNGQISVQNPWNIFSEEYSFFSERLVLKLCNGKSILEDFVNFFDNIDIIFFVRHPVPQSLSVMNRNWSWKSIYAYLDNEKFTNNLTNFQLEKALEICKEPTNNNNQLEKHVLNWILENLIPLKLIEKKKYLY